MIEVISIFIAAGVWAIALELYEIRQILVQQAAGESAAGGQK